MLEQGFDLGCEREQAPVPVVIKRLDSQPVARAKQTPLASVPDGEREHPAEQLQALGPMFLVGVENCFRVGTRAIAMAGALQRRPQLRMVVDLAVVNDRQRPGFVQHGLVAAGYIHDAQPAMPQMGELIVIEAKIVRSAMSKGLGHPTKVRHAARIRPRGDKTSHPAHVAVYVLLFCVSYVAHALVRAAFTLM